ncbi:hypothetical protein ACFC1R_32500 [Kitasatospora sp. NPDC056138]|uniref:hypothetical protein n=1 Tax=Kitasatospora sp. NPDC056138 TaxID=3345724 RepID=UPI0035E1189B
MTDSVNTPTTVTPSLRGGWWKAPMISSLVTGLCLPPAMFLRGIAEMATDPCSGPGSCPSTLSGLALADHLLAAAPVLLVLQWPAAYLLPKARVPIALAPAMALLVMVLVVLGIKPGT